MFFLSLETSTVAFRTVLDELLCFFLALNLTFFQYFCQESFFFASLFTFQRKFALRIPAKIPRNRPFSPRICLFKSREISLFFPRIIRSPDKWHYCAMNENCCGVDWERAILGGGAFALFLRPHHGAFGSLSAAAPRNLPSKGKKC